MKDEILLFLQNLRKRMEAAGQNLVEQERQRAAEIRNREQGREAERQIRGGGATIEDVPWMQDRVPSAGIQAPTYNQEAHQRAGQDYIQTIQDLLNTKGVDAAREFIHSTPRPPIEGIDISPDGRLIRVQPPAPHVSDDEAVIARGGVKSYPPSSPVRPDGQKKQMLAVRDDAELAKDQPPVLAQQMSSPTPEQQLASLYALYQQNKKSTISGPEVASTTFPVGRLSRGFG